MWSLLFQPRLHSFMYSVESVLAGNMKASNFVTVTGRTLAAGGLLLSSATHGDAIENVSPPLEACRPAAPPWPLPAASPCAACTAGPSSCRQREMITRRWALCLASKPTPGGSLALLFDTQEAKGCYIAATYISSNFASAIAVPMLPGQ